MKADEKGGVAFRVGHANPGGSRVEGDATDAGRGRRRAVADQQRAADRLLGERVRQLPRARPQRA
jgi:hypothetical protein